MRAPSAAGSFSMRTLLPLPLFKTTTQKYLLSKAACRSSWPGSLGAQSSPVHVSWVLALNNCLPHVPLPPKAHILWYFPPLGFFSATMSALSNARAPPVSFTAFSLLSREQV